MGRGIQSVSAQLIGGVPGGQRRRRGVGRAGPWRQHGQHGDDALRIGQRPPGRDHRADRDSADGDRSAQRCLVECLPVPADQVIGPRRHRHQDRARILQRPGENATQVVVIRSRSGQQDRHHAAQVDRHPTIVPVADAGDARGCASWRPGTKRSTVAGAV